MTIQLSQIEFAYGHGRGRHRVLTDATMSVHTNEFVAVLGFSGCGKSTLIGLLAGLLQPESGVVQFGGKSNPPPGPDRGIVFQNYSLLPWLTVFGNIELAVKQSFPNLTARERAAHIQHYIDLVKLTNSEWKRPHELSGGMRQRLALARTLSMQPQLLLLDEPLSALDALTRSVLQDELIRIWEQDKRTVVLVTNDVDEAILLADRIITLTPGPIATIGEQFAVDLPRPRDRSELNFSSQFKELRNRVTRYLLDANNRFGTQGTPTEQYAEAPTIQPFFRGDVNELPRHAAAQSPYTSSSQVALESGSSVACVKATPQSRYVELFQLTRSYATPAGPPHVVVEEFDLIMRRGDVISLIGHSGCGKSTVLTMAAGLNEPTRGSVVVDGREASGPGPDRAVVFQTPCLLPWLSAYDNVRLGVDRVYENSTDADRHALCEHYLSAVGMQDDMFRSPREMSAGMQQRVGIARAIALKPRLLLLDEPFGRLDSLTRMELQDVILRVLSDEAITTLLVTHDVDEALYMSDRICMMTSGPRARIGQLLEVPFARPRLRHEVLEHELYYDMRACLVTFLEQQHTSVGRLRDFEFVSGTQLAVETLTEDHTPIRETATPSQESFSLVP